MEEEYEYQDIHPLLTHGLPFLCVLAFILGILWLNSVQKKSDSLDGPVVLFGIPLAGLALWMALIGWWIFIEEELDGLIDPNIIYSIPIIGLGLWIGLISGFIPSFLCTSSDALDK